MTKFGIEEEFFLLDRQTLAPVSLGMPARDSVVREQMLGTASAEFLACQVEHSTSPLAAVDEAREQLLSFRWQLSDFADRNNVLSAGVATPFGPCTSTVVSPSERYESLGRWLGDIVAQNQVNGLHVHVEIADADDRVRGLNALRPWLPVLVALSANSPFWREHDTSFSSWRSILLRRFPTHGCPPAFRDANDYQARTQRLIELGAAPDVASLWWAARVSANYPTVETRVFDAQLTADDALLMVLLTRALVTSQIASAAHVETDAVNASIWMAARETE